MKALLEQLSKRSGQFLPMRALKRALSIALGDGRVALCLHRVLSRRRNTDWQPFLTIPPDELDSLIELLLESRERSERWLTLSFDDGYRDAAEYVATRARRYAQADFLLFVCPEKIEARVGFRWDLVEERLKAGEPLERASQRMEDELRILDENQRAELRALPRNADFGLAEIQELKALQSLPNVALGNHSNCHFKGTQLSIDEARLEYQRSSADFIRLFGAHEQFAFPFGVPRHHFDVRHVEALRSLGNFTIWSTESRPFAAHERRAGAVLPRFSIDGTLSFRESASWIASRAAFFRLRGTKHRFAGADLPALDHRA